MRRPNILLFHCHDLGRHLGCYGVPTVRSPNLDRFADEGVRFERAFCTAPQCSPSRASLFTGRYPHENGVMGLTHDRFAWDLHPGERHLAGLLREAGYATTAVGVTHETRRSMEAMGYTERHGGRRAAEVADTAIRVLEERAGAAETPFFLYAGTFEPHRLQSSRHDPDHMGFLGDDLSADESGSVDVPGYLKDDEGTRRELAEIQGAVREVDTQFGRVLEALDRLGLSEDTLVVFTSDHGLALPRAKCTCYDPGLEVPLLLRLPSREGWHGGRVRDEMVPNIDVFTTLCELGGAPVPQGVRGRSFAPLLDGEAYARNEAVFAEMTYHNYYDPMRAIRTDRHKLIVYFSAAPAFMDCSESWRPRAAPRVPEVPGVAYHPNVELYDLEADPWEQNNLADDPAHEAIRRDLLKRLYRHLRETDDPILQGAVTPPIHDDVRRLLEEA